MSARQHIIWLFGSTHGRSPIISRKKYIIITVHLILFLVLLKNKDS